MGGCRPGKALFVVLVALSVSMAAPYEAPLAAGQWADCLAALEGEIKGGLVLPEHAQRCAVGALAVDQLRDPAAEAEWRSRLAGEIKPAVTIYDLVLGLLHHRYDALHAPGQSFEILDPTSALIQRLAAEPARPEWRDVAALVALVGLRWCGGDTGGRGRRVLARCQLLSAEGRRAVLDYHREHAHVLAAKQLLFRRVLEQLLRDKLVTDPFLPDLLLALTPDPRSRLRLAPYLEAAGFKEQALACGREAAQAPFADEQTFRQVLTQLANARKTDELIAAYRRAEAELEPFAARRARLSFLWWLVNVDYAESHGRGTRPAGLPTLDEERRARREQAQDGAAARLALADVAFVTQNYGLAGDGYERLLAEELPPVQRLVVITALGAVDPSAAWDHLARLSPDERDRQRTVGLAVVIGLAAGRLGELADWLERAAAGEVKWWPDVRAELASVLAVAGRPTSARAVLNGETDQAAAERCVDAMGRFSQGNLPVSSEADVRLLDAARDTLKVLPERRLAWSAAAEYALAAAAKVRTAPFPARYWPAVIGALPDQPEEADLRAVQALRAVCLGWLDAHPKDESVLRTLLEYEASALTVEPSRLRETSTMLIECLERAVRVNYPPHLLTMWVRDYRTKLTKLAVDPEERARIEQRLDELMPPGP